MEEGKVSGERDFLFQRCIALYSYSMLISLIQIRAGYGRQILPQLHSIPNV